MKSKRNTHFIGFSDEEFAAIKKAAAKAGLYPRQLIMQSIK